MMYTFATKFDIYEEYARNNDIFIIRESSPLFCLGHPPSYVSSYILIGTFSSFAHHHYECQ